jgi:hypothetical protein
LLIALHKDNSMPETVTLPSELWTNTQSRLSQMEAEIAAKNAETQVATTRALLARGETETVLANHRRDLAEANKRAASLAIENTVSKALEGIPMKSAAAASQARELLSRDLVADVGPDGRTFTVRTQAFKPAADHIRETLAQPEWSHFRNDAAGSPANRPTPGVPGAPTQPALPYAQPSNLSEALINDRVAAQAARAEAVAGKSAATNMSMGFGLGNNPARPSTPFGLFGR